MATVREAWLSQAAADLDAARYSVHSGHYDQACHQSQQCAENALKALLVDDQGQIPRQHRHHTLAKLLQACLPIARELNHFTQKAAYLDPFYEASRYPDALKKTFADDRSPSEYFRRETAFQSDAFQTNAFQVGGKEARRCVSSAESIFTAVQTYFTTCPDP